MWAARVQALPTMGSLLQGCGRQADNHIVQGAHAVTMRMTMQHAGAHSEASGQQQASRPEALWLSECRAAGSGHCCGAVISQAHELMTATQFEEAYPQVLQ